MPKRFEERFSRSLNDGGPPRLHAPRQRWFIELGRGRNLRSLDELPVPLTARMAPEVVIAPEDLALYPAFRWAQVFGRGGRDRVTAAFAHSPIARPPGPEGEAFFDEVAEKLVRAPLPVAAQVAPLLDYLRYVRFRESAPRCEVRRDGLPNPRYRLGQRALHTVLREAGDWHARRAASGRRSMRLSWRARGYNRALDKGRFDELTSSEQLRAEGAELRHCIESYDWACAFGHAAVVSCRPGPDDSEQVPSPSRRSKGAKPGRGTRASQSASAKE